MIYRHQSMHILQCESNAPTNNLFNPQIWPLNSEKTNLGSLKRDIHQLGNISGLNIIKHGCQEEIVLHNTLGLAKHIFCTCPIRCVMHTRTGNTIYVPAVFNAYVHPLRDSGLVLWLHMKRITYHWAWLSIVFLSCLQHVQ